MKTDSKRPMFVWTIHHALYDGWSIMLLHNALENAYEGVHQPSPPYQSFVKHLISIDESQASAF